MSVRDELPQGGEEPSVGLLGVDLDGTLLNSEWTLSERSRRARLRAHESGLQLAIVTGRRYWAARRLTSRIRCPHYLVTNAGAQTTTSHGEVLASRPTEFHSKPVTNNSNWQIEKAAFMPPFPRTVQFYGMQQTSTQSGANRHCLRA